MTKPTLLVLAAGMGSRYGGLKQMDPVGPGGETIIDFSVHDAMRAGFGKLVFVIRRGLEEQFREIVGKRFEDRITVRYAFQEITDLPAGFSPPPGRTKPWGTAHAVLAGESAINEPFVAINADDFYGAESFQLLAKFLSDGGPDFAMAGFRLRNTLSEHGSVARGICKVSANGLLESVEEMTKIEHDGDQARNTDPSGKVTPLTGDEIVSMNFWGFTPAIFPALRAKFTAFIKERGTEPKSECYLPTVVSDLINEGQAKVHVLRTNASWFGVTYQEDRPRVVASIRELVGRGDYNRDHA